MNGDHRTTVAFDHPASEVSAMARSRAASALERIAIVCTDNMDADCNHRMALDFVRQIANDALAPKVKGQTLRQVYATEYDAWRRVKGRCTNNRNKDYPQYGGRGITICDKWLNNFEAFFSDMGPRPSAGHSVERNDSAGNYEPSNCRWATRVEQNNNRSTVRRFPFRGEMMTIRAAMQMVGCVLPHHLVRTRVSRGWDIERALRTDANKNSVVR